MKKIDLSDVTFLIPVRVDSIIRLENLLMTIDFLYKNFQTQIMVLEADAYPNGIIRKLLPSAVKYFFVEDKDLVFYRTKYLNEMTLKSATAYLGVWDADVIVPKEQIAEATTQLRSGSDIAYPYKGLFYETSYPIRELYLKTKKIEVFIKNKNKMQLPAGDTSLGGAFMVCKSVYVRAGMENSKFYGWGSEDTERYYRWLGLGYKIHFTTGCLYHLTHPRGSNSKFRSTNEKSNSERELALTKKSTEQELVNCIALRMNNKKINA